MSDKPLFERSNVILLPGLRRPSDDESQRTQTTTPSYDISPPAVTDDSCQTDAPPDHLIQPAVEALLLAAEGPITDDQISGWLGLNNSRRVRTALHDIQLRLQREDRGIQLTRVARGWQLRTDIRFGQWVSAMRGNKPFVLSRAALEVLSIVAYRQPVTRNEVEELRGVDAGGVLRMLCEKQLIAVSGRLPVAGRPLVYGTTGNFLSIFGLRDLSELPTLSDLRSLQLDQAEGPSAGNSLPLDDDNHPPDLKG